MSKPSLALVHRDRFFDFSLRVLMLAVVAGLIACVAWLTWHWSRPPAPASDEVPVAQTAPKAEPSFARGAEERRDSRQLLMAPGQVFRCESGGTVTFTDRPCTTQQP